MLDEGTTSTPVGILDFRQAVTQVPLDYIPPEPTTDPEEPKPTYTMADCSYSSEERTLQAMKDGIILPANAEYCLIEKFGNSSLEASDKVQETISQPGYGEREDEFDQTPPTNGNDSGNDNGNGVEGAGSASILEIGGVFVIGVAKGTLIATIPIISMAVAVGFMRRVVKIGTGVGG